MCGARMRKSESIRARVSNRQLAEIEEAIFELHRQGVKVTMSEIIRAGIEKELAWIRNKEHDPIEHRSRETKLWDLITNFLHDMNKS